MNILTALALLLVPAAPSPVSVSPVSMLAPSAVVVKIGQASLEEYTHGDPANRVQLGDNSRNAKKL